MIVVNLAVTLACKPLLISEGTDGLNPSQALTKMGINR